jgi:hypothetical protein
MYEIPRWWSTRIETCRKTCKVTYKNKIKSVHLLATKFTSITEMHGATHIKNTLILHYNDKSLMLCEEIDFIYGEDYTVSS